MLAVFRGHSVHSIGQQPSVSVYKSSSADEKAERHTLPIYYAFHWIDGHGLKTSHKWQIVTAVNKLYYVQ